MADAIQDGVVGSDDGGVQQHLSTMFGRDSIYMVMWAVQLGAAALFTPLNTRLLGPGRFGRVAAAIAVTQLVYAFGNLQLQASIQRRYAEDPDEAHRLILLAIILAVLATALAYVTGPLWSPALGFGQFDGAAQWAVLWGGVTALTGSSLGLLKSQDRLGAFGTVTLLQSVGGQVAAIVLVLAVHRTASIFVFGLLLGQAAAAAVALRCAPPKWATWRDLPMARAALAYSIPLVPGALAAFVLSVADRLILQSKLGPIAVGRYQVAYNLGALAITLLGGLNMVWMPRIFAIKDESTRATVLAQARDSVYLILLPVVVGLSIGAPLVLKIWTPPSYLPEGLMVVLTIVAVSAIPYASSLAHTRVLLASGRTWALAWTILVAAGVNIALNFALIPRWRIDGSAAATLVSYVVLSILIRWRADREYKLAATPWITQFQLAAGVGCAFLWSKAPTTTDWIIFRTVLAALCVLWFALVARSVVPGQPKTS